jgi:hypothetical protein
MIRNTLPIKHEDVYSLTTHMHPYVDMDSLTRFRYSYIFYNQPDSIKSRSSQSKTIKPSKHT